MLTVTKQQLAALSREREDDFNRRLREAVATAIPHLAEDTEALGRAVATARSDAVSAGALTEFDIAVLTVESAKARDANDGYLPSEQQKVLNANNMRPSAKAVQLRNLREGKEK